MPVIKKNNVPHPTARVAAAPVRCRENVDSALLRQESGYREIVEAYLKLAATFIKLPDHAGTSSSMLFYFSLLKDMHENSIAINAIDKELNPTHYRRFLGRRKDYQTVLRWFADEEYIFPIAKAKNAFPTYDLTAKSLNLLPYFVANVRDSNTTDYFVPFDPVLQENPQLTQPSGRLKDMGIRLRTMHCIPMGEGNIYAGYLQRERGDVFNFVDFGNDMLDMRLVDSAQNKLQFDLCNDKTIPAKLLNAEADAKALKDRLLPYGYRINDNMLVFLTKTTAQRVLVPYEIIVWFQQHYEEMGFNLFGSVEKAAGSYRQFYILKMAVRSASGKLLGYYSDKLVDTSYREQMLSMVFPSV